MAEEGSSIARLLRGETGKKGAPSDMETLDLLNRFGGGGGHSDSAWENKITNLEVKVPARGAGGRRLDLPSDNTFLTPRHHHANNGHQDFNLPPPAASAAVWTIDMVRSALEHAFARRSAAYLATSSSLAASTFSSSSSSVDKRHRSSPTSPSMCAAVCPSCLTFVLFSEADPRCPRCSATVPSQLEKTIHAATTEGSGKKPMIDLNAPADETE